MCGCKGCHLLTTDIEKRNTETAAGRETEVENRETKETDRYRDRERQRKQETWWWCWGGRQLAFDGEACLFNECISPLHTYPQITASH